MKWESFLLKYYPVKDYSTSIKLNYVQLIDKNLFRNILNIKNPGLGFKNVLYNALKK